MNLHIPLLITPILLSDASWFDIGEPFAVSFASIDSEIALTQ